MLLLLVFLDVLAPMVHAAVLVGFLSSFLVRLLHGFWVLRLIFYFLHCHNRNNRLDLSFYLLLKLHLTALLDPDADFRLVLLTGLNALDVLDDFLAAFDPAEDNVLVVKPWGLLKSDEELAAVRITA